MGFKVVMQFTRSTKNTHRFDAKESEKASAAFDQIYIQKAHMPMPASSITVEVLIEGVDYKS